MSVSLGNMNDSINLKLAKQINGQAGTSLNSRINNKGGAVYAGHTAVYGDTAELPADVKDFILQAKKVSFDLENSLAELMIQKVSEAEEQVEAFSSDEDKLKAKVERQMAADKEKTTVKIDQKATAQKSESKSFVSQSLDFKAGKSYAMTVKKADKEMSFSLKAGEKASNKDVLEKLADRINSEEMGLTATVEYGKNARNGKSIASLSIESDETGKKEKFSVSGTLAKALKMTVSNQATDAVYSVDGAKKQSSPSNTIKMENGVSIEIKEASNKPVDISFKSGNSAAADKFVRNYNSLFDMTGKTGGDGSQLGKGLNSKLSGLSQEYKSELKEAGIEVLDSGKLKINDGKKDGVIGHKLKDFGEKLGNVLSKANGNPTSYLDNLNNKNSYAKTMNMYENKGMFFNIAV